MMLADLCPRIAAARDAFRAAELAWDVERRRLISARCDLERLVAHRDLQVIRSESARRARSNAKYMAWRLAKLARAQAALAAVLAALDALERVAPGDYSGRRVAA